MASERICEFCSASFLGRKNGRWCNPDCRKSGLAAENKSRLLTDPEFREANRIRSEKFRIDNPEQVRKRKSEWYQANYSEVRVKHRNYYLANREKLAVTSTLWKERNPEIVRSIKSRYKYARRLNMDKSGVLKVTGRDLKRQLARQGNACSYCKTDFGTELKATWDHIIPVSRGGRHSIGNLVACCQSCNSSKNNKTVTEWRKWQRESQVERVN